MSDSSDDSDLFEVVADSFLARIRAGERPGIEEYATRHPALAEQIRDLFPALVMVEQELGPSGAEVDQGGARRSAPLSARAGAPCQLGDFRIIREIGRGGMGVVYEAVQESLGRHVALKILPWSSTGDPSKLERFLREARAAARLHHTNIVPVFGVGEHEGTHFFAMQFIQGQGLDVIIEEVRRLRSSATQPGFLSGGSTVLSDHSDLTASERHYYRGVARIALQVAEAMAHAHDQGILHRDIKPSNLIMDAHGTVWVTDFGLAKADDSDGLTGTGDVIGTLRYMAPERFEGHSDPRSDLYALGATIYELLTLRPIFEGTSRGRLVDQIIQRDPVRPRTIAPRTPRDLEVICLKCLAKEPSNRYPTAAELAAELRRFLTGESIRARRSSSLERGWRWARRNPIVAGSLGVTAASLVAVALLSVFHARAEMSTARDLARRLAAIHHERGQAACERGEIGPGLLWLVESWRAAVTAGDPGWQHAARASLAAWQGEHPGLKWVVSHQNTIPPRCAVFSPDGRTVLTGGYDRTARLWETASGRPLGTPMEHQSSVLAVAFSPDGRTILTGSYDKTARLWNAATGRPITAPLLHQGIVYAVAFSPDGRMALTGCDDSTARLWDAGTGRPVGTPMRHRAGLSAVAFSADGKTILTGSKAARSAQLWDAATGRAVGASMEHRDDLTCVIFSPDGRTVLTGSDDKTARLWDASTGRPIGDPLEHQGSVFCLAFSPDGRTALTGSDDNTARLWDTATGRPRAPPLPQMARVTAVAFSPDGGTALIGTGNEMARRWDIATGRPVGSPLNHQGTIYTVAFSPDGQSALTASTDGTVRLWDAALPRRIETVLPHGGWVETLAFSPDGKTALTGGNDGTARLWDAASGRSLTAPLKHQGQIRKVVFSPDGRSILTASFDGTAQLWDAATGRPTTPPLEHQGRVTSVAFSPDGRSVVTASVDHTARLWNAADGRPFGAPMKHRGAVVAVAFSPDGRRVLTGSDDHTACLWDSTDGQAVGPPLEHRGWVWAVAFAPDSRRVLTGSLDGTAQLWDAATGRPTTPPLEHQGMVHAVAYSPDGRTVLSGGFDGRAQLWDAATGRSIGPALRHQARVFDVAYSPDGRTLLTCSDDKTARLWDTATGQPIGPPLRHEDCVDSVAFCPDDRWVLTGSHDGTARLWPRLDLPDDLERVATWIEALTGLSLDPSGAVHSLDHAHWIRVRALAERESGRIGPG